MEVLLLQLKQTEKLENGDEGSGEGSDEGVFKLFDGSCFLTDRWTKKQTDIGDCRVTFVTEKLE